MTIYAIFSDKYMPQLSDFWAAFSTLEKAIEALVGLSDTLIREYRLEIYEIPIDGTQGQGKKRLNVDDPRIIEITKSLASRGRDSS